MKPRSFLRFSLLMPLLGLVLSLTFLYPSRKIILNEMLFSIASRRPVPVAAPPSLDIQILSETASTFEQEWDAENRRIAKVTALNLPALVFDLPVAILSKDHQSWHPRGMDFKNWHAISYPFVGIFFWWLVGRGLDRLFGDTQFIHSNKTIWPEFILASLLFSGSLALCIGWIFTTTPDDRASIELRWTVYGGMLWLFLEAFAIAGWTRLIISLKRETRIQTGDEKPAL